MLAGPGRKTAHYDFASEFRDFGRFDFSRFALPLKMIMPRPFRGGSNRRFGYRASRSGPGSASAPAELGLLAMSQA